MNFRKLAAVSYMLPIPILSTKQLFRLLNDLLLIAITHYTFEKKGICNKVGKVMSGLVLRMLSSRQP